MVHKLRNIKASTWLIPLGYAVAALTDGPSVSRAASILLPGFVSTISFAAAIGIYSAIASGMIALTGNQ